MANVIDFSPLRGDPYAGALDPVLKALDERNRRKDAAEAQAAQLAFQREQEQRRVLSENDKTQHEQALEAQAMRKQQGIETVSNNKGREAADQRIRAAAGAGDFAEAQRVSDAYSEVDPVTAAVKSGRGFSVNNAPVEMGPQATPEETDQAATIRALDDPAGMTPESAQQQFSQGEAERQRFQRANTPGAEPVQQGNKLVDPSNVASVNIGGATMTPDDIRHSQSRAAGRDFEAVGQALQEHYAQAVSTGDPVTIAAAKRQLDAYARTAPGVASGAISPTSATQQVAGAASSEARFEQNSQLADQRGDIGSALQTQRDSSALESAKVTADAAAQRAQATAAKGDNKEQRQRVQVVEGVKNKFAAQYQLGPDRQARSKMQELLTGADNPVTQKSLANLLMRVKAGEKGVTTDKDRDFIIGNVEGKLGGFDNAVSELDSGMMSPSHLAVIKEAMQQSLDSNNQREEAAIQAWADGVRGNPTYNQWGLGSHMDAQANELFGPGGAERVRKAAKVSGPEPKATSPAGVSGGEAPLGGVLQHNPKTGQERWKMPDGTYIEKR